MSPFGLRWNEILAVVSYSPNLGLEEFCRIFRCGLEVIHTDKVCYFRVIFFCGQDYKGVAFVGACDHSFVFFKFRFYAFN